MKEFISEESLGTFESWLRYQAIDKTTCSLEELAMWQREFDDAMKRTVDTNKVGLMKLKQVPFEHKYAVAIEHDSELWLTLWVRRSQKGEFFVFQPRGDRGHNPHTSYHLDGTLHMKSYDHKGLTQKRQPLTVPFRGTEHLGTYLGHSTKIVGAICDPSAFTGVLRVPRDVLGPRHGQIVVDLTEPNHELPEFSGMQIEAQQVFKEVIPWVVITVGSSG